MCLAELLIGILLLINPVGFTSVILGLIMASIGIINIVSYFRTDPILAAEQTGLAKGLLLCTAGLFCIFKSSWFISTFPLLTTIYGILILLLGFSKTQWAVDMLRNKQRYCFIAGISAALTLILSILILLNPFASTAVLWTFIAMILIIESVVDIAALIFDKRASGETN